MQSQYLVSVTAGDLWNAWIARYLCAPQLIIIMQYQCALCTPINNHHAIPVITAAMFWHRCTPSFAPNYTPTTFCEVSHCWWHIFRFGQISGSLCTLCSCMRWLSQRLLIEGNFCKISRLFEKWNKSFQRLINRTFRKWGPTWVTTWKVPNDIQN